jgi:hypothetical protein
MKTPEENFKHAGQNTKGKEIWQNKTAFREPELTILFSVCENSYTKSN